MKIAKIFDAAYFAYRKLFSPKPRVGDKVTAVIDWSVTIRGVVSERSDFPEFDMTFYRVDGFVVTENMWLGRIEKYEKGVSVSGERIWITL